jgi:hypothetical protein
MIYGGLFVGDRVNQCQEAVEVFHRSHRFLSMIQRYPI